MPTFPILQYRKPTPSTWLALLAICSMILAGCGPSTEGSNPVDRKVVTIVATTGMIADVVANIGGDYVNVHPLMGPGVDPHLYKATESDVSKLLNADMIIYNGLFLESRMTEIFEQMSARKAIVAVGEAIPQDRLLVSPRYPDQPDPHIWMDVKLWMQVAEKVRNELQAFDPDHADTYDINAAAYIRPLQELDSYVNKQIQTIPREQRVLVTAHDAFAYFGKGYGVDVFAPQGISTESEAGVDDIRRTIDVVVERNIPAIFVESSVPPDIVEAIVEGARARGHDIEIGGQLFSDAMGEAGSPEGTYTGMIRHNVDTIVNALRQD